MPEILGSFTLSNGMHCVWGKPADEGVSVDIYDDSSMQLLIGLEHHIRVSYIETVTNEEIARCLNGLIESFIDELEDSVVYYYGPRECPLEDSELRVPAPRKTGRFA